MDSKKVWEKVKENISGYELKLGTYFSRQLLVDAKHVLFTLSRYKFAAKMIGVDSPYTVVELGCNEGLGSLLLSQFAMKVVGVDFDQRAINWATENLTNEKLEFISMDF